MLPTSWTSGTFMEYYTEQLQNTYVKKGSDGESVGRLRSLQLKRKLIDWRCGKPKWLTESFAKLFAIRHAIKALSSLPLLNSQYHVHHTVCFIHYSVFHFGDRKMCWQNMWLARDESRASCEKSVVLGLWFSPIQDLGGRGVTSAQIKLSSKKRAGECPGLWDSRETGGQPAAIRKAHKSTAAGWWMVFKLALMEVPKSLRNWILSWKMKGDPLQRWSPLPRLGYQTHFHQGPHQPRGCLQRAECNFNSLTAKE